MHLVVSFNSQLLGLWIIDVHETIGAWHGKIFVSCAMPDCVTEF